MRFAELREKAGLTQKQAAAALGVDQSAISFWETSINNPRTAMLPKIAALYGCTVDELLEEQQEGKKA